MTAPCVVCSKPRTAGAMGWQDLLCTGCFDEFQAWWASRTAGSAMTAPMLTLEEIAVESRRVHTHADRCYGPYEPCGEHHVHDDRCGNRPLICYLREEAKLGALCSMALALLDVADIYLPTPKTTEQVVDCVRSSDRTLGKMQEEWMQLQEVVPGEGDVVERVRNAMRFKDALSKSHDRLNSACLEYDRRIAALEAELTVLKEELRTEEEFRREETVIVERSIEFEETQQQLITALESQLAEAHKTIARLDNEREHYRAESFERLERAQRAEADAAGDREQLRRAEAERNANMLGWNSACAATDAVIKERDEARRERDMALAAARSVL